MPSQPRPNRTGVGLAFAIGAYGLWGFLPLYFTTLVPVGPIEVVAWRVVLSLVFCAILLTVTRGWRAVAAIACDRRTMVIMAFADVLNLTHIGLAQFFAPCCNSSSASTSFTRRCRSPAGSVSFSCGSP